MEQTVLEDVRVTREDVRAGYRRYKEVMHEMRNALDDFENAHTAYAEKRGLKKHTAQFNSIRKSMFKLLEEIKTDNI